MNPSNAEHLFGLTDATMHLFGEITGRVRRPGPTVISEQFSTAMFTCQVFGVFPSSVVSSSCSFFQWLLPNMFQILPDYLTTSHSVRLASTFLDFPHLAPGPT